MRDIRKWLPASEPKQTVPESGEARHGVVVLAWDDAVAGAREPGDGQNVVYHEFAHQLDFEHHLTSDAHNLADLMEGAMTPVVADPEMWQRVWKASYERFCDRLDRGQPVVLDRYAATDAAEFFAVATEVFFEQPRALRSDDPNLYEQLRGFYRQDPAGR